MLRLAVRVSREHAELVLAELLELAPSGVEETEIPDGTIEYAVYGAPGELPELPDLKAAAGEALVEVSTREVADDWQDRWRQFHHPLVLGDRLTVRPPWEPPGATALDVVIDPGQAFGTGAHPTTRLCLEAILELAPGSGTFVDLGCGSGVLALTALQLGWGPVVALDFDAAAIEATSENARRNHALIGARRYDLRSDPIDATVAPMVAANLLAPLLEVWAGRLAEAGRAPDRIIAGGLLAHEGDRAARAFAPLGLREERRLTAGDWTALVLASEPISD